MHYLHNIALFGLSQSPLMLQQCRSAQLAMHVQADFGLALTTEQPFLPTFCTCL